MLNAVISEVEHYSELKYRNYRFNMLHLDAVVFGCAASMAMLVGGKLKPSSLLVPEKFVIAPYFSLPIVAFPCLKFNAGGVLRIDGVTSAVLDC